MLASHCLWAGLVAFLVGLTPTCVQANVVELEHMQRLESDTVLPPDAGKWTETALPYAAQASLPGQPTSVAWYRGRFDVPEEGDVPAAWAVYLPFFYQGGQIWVNGKLAGNVPESTPAVRVRWERPQLFTLPPGLLQPHGNVLAIRAAAAPTSAVQYFPQVTVGPLADLQPSADRRTFWVRTMPQVTVVVCLLVAGFMLFIYWRRRSEVLYGLFGLATALWGLRTLTFIIERMSVDSWQLWRITYLASTGGFIVVLALFTLRLAGIRKPALEKALVGYWIVGPLWLSLAGSSAEPFINYVWSTGLVPIGLAILGVSGWSLLRQRTLAAAVMPLTLMVAVLTGVHDYLMAWDIGLLARWLPSWSNQRIFLMHYGAIAVLLGMGGWLAARFIEALSSLQFANQNLADLNETLERRVAQREQHLAANFEHMADMQREHAAVQERQLIMREIHDGLGSRLFTSLLRVERGDMTDPQIAEALRECIADMRLAFDALSPNDDFQATLGNFLFRWKTQMQEAHIQPTWTLDIPEGGLHLARQPALHLLRIAQEALTNVLKHAHARNVRIELRDRGDMLELEVADDGTGTDLSNGMAGRGVANMRARARQMGAELELRSDAGGTRVMLRMPLVRKQTQAPG